MQDHTTVIAALAVATLATVAIIADRARTSRLLNTPEGIASGVAAIALAVAIAFLAKGPTGGGGLVTPKGATEITDAQYDVLHGYRTQRPDIRPLIDYAMRDGRVTPVEYDALMRAVADQPRPEGSGKAALQADVTAQAKIGH